MTWEQTHRRHDAVRRIEHDARRDPRLPWDPELRELFGTRERLLAFLRRRWETALQAQLDDVEGAARLRARYAGTRRLLALHDHAREDLPRAS